MLLKKITLQNFRQFKGVQTINFSDNLSKNVTVIIGENGSGKTTLAQAFTWCLYGTTDFKIKECLNLDVKNSLQVGESSTVSVELELIHRNIPYIIKREQVYFKETFVSVKKNTAKLSVIYKKDGQQEMVKPNLCDAKIKEILPKDLSRYFFFDGERIEKMSDEIQSGKSNEFSEAVKSLLGLNTYSAAIRHLGGKSRAGKNSSVIGSYNAQYDNSNDDRIRKYSAEYDEFQAQLDSLYSRKTELEKQIPTIEKICDDLKETIAVNSDGETLKKQQERLEHTISINQMEIYESTGKILDEFKRNYKYYFYKKMVSDAMELLSNADKIDKGIPHIHEDTIKFLINRGYCICGNEIHEGNDEYNKLMQLLNFIPPHSLGTEIDYFVKDCKAKAEGGSDIYNVVKEIMQKSNEKIQQNETCNDELEEINKKLQSYKSIGPLQIQLNSYKLDLNKKRNELSDIDTKIGETKTKQERVATNRNNLALQSDTNKKLAKYLAYAEKILECLSQEYKQREDEVRKSLELAINDIFTKIYHGGLALKIDEKYNVETVIKDLEKLEGRVETSTAQSISIIFAFISGVIKLARETQEKDEKDLASEPYPLVMDAPLSTFDKERIKTVCETLPDIAEQVIIFIKNTDGEIAEHYLSDKIGLSYEFVKKSETETYLNSRL